MRVAVLFSGGKDSVRTVHSCLEKGHDVKYLVTIIPKREDSWMYHVPNVHLTELSAEAMGIPLISRESSGEKEREVEDMEIALKNLDVDAVACGGLFSEYQKSRIKGVCDRLSLKFLAPFWRADPEKFMRDIIDLGFDVKIVGVYAEGFNESWLGKKLTPKTLKELRELNEKYGISLVGEGGEYESLVVDGPIFKGRIKILQSKRVWDERTQSGHLEVIKAKLIRKRPVS